MNRIRKIMSLVTIALIILILAAIIIAALQSMVSCADSEAQNPTSNFRHPYKVYTIDSCEYITVAGANGFNGITHKGNCRHCQRRQQVQIDSLLNQIFD